jgi:hypothetical protein
MSIHRGMNIYLRKMCRRKKQDVAYQLLFWADKVEYRVERIKGIFVD